MQKVDGTVFAAVSAATRLGRMVSGDARKVELQG
jgi:hypothetical protein